MSQIKIIKEKCVGCGLCVNQCPFGAISISNKKAEISEACTLCSSCVESCRFNAIELTKTEKNKEVLTDYRGIWVIVEQKNKTIRSVTYELLNQARLLATELGEKVTAVFLGKSLGKKGDDLIAYGADKVLGVEADWLEDNNDQVYGPLLIDLILKEKPEILLIGATSFGRSLAPNIASTLHTGLTADCTMLEIDTKERLLLQTRPAFGGNLMATIVCPNTRPQMATVRPKIFKPMKPDYDIVGEIQRLKAPKQIESLVKKLRIIDLDSSSNIVDAEIVIGVGKGIGSKKNIKLAEELARKLGGVVAASRPVVDEGWLPYSQQVGQTGKTISPKLYIACGISGAIQHIAGMADIETIIAINSDSDAPIFNYAHYKIVGDCTEVISELILQLDN